MSPVVSLKSHVVITACELFASCNYSACGYHPSARCFVQTNRKKNYKIGIFNKKESKREDGNGRKHSRVDHRIRFFTGYVRCAETDRLLRTTGISETSANHQSKGITLCHLKHHRDSPEGVTSIYAHPSPSLFSFMLFFNICSFPSFIISLQKGPDVETFQNLVTLLRSYQELLKEVFTDAAAKELVFNDLELRFQVSSSFFFFFFFFFC